MRTNLRRGAAFLAFAALLFPRLILAAPSQLANATILIIRHAEKPASGSGLTPEGSQRADAYVDYFKNLQIDGKPFALDWIYVAADSQISHRPSLTLTPLSKALKLPLDTKFKDRECAELAADLRARPHGKHILICWHHTAIPVLAKALGADPARLLPGGKWPGSVFGWMIELHYDTDGKLMPNACRLINERLMPDDARKSIDAR